MKQRFYLFRRRGTFYLQDARTHKQSSLDTKDRSTALRLLEIKRQTNTHDGFNQLILKTCLTTSDSMLTRRTWEDVMAEMKTHGRESAYPHFLCLVWMLENNGLGMIGENHLIQLLSALSWRNNRFSENPLDGPEKSADEVLTKIFKSRQKRETLHGRIHIGLQRP